MTMNTTERPRGRFIVVEGLDGSGKSTLATSLADQLDAVRMATPGAALQPIRARFHEAMAEHRDGMVLFYAASCLVAGEEAEGVVNGGRDVVMDRYWASTIAYGRARGSALRLREVEEKLIHPDVTILLEIQEAERTRRLMARGVNAYDIETLDRRFAHSVMNEYRELLAGPIGGVVLRATELMSVGEVASAILRSARRAS